MAAKVLCMQHHEPTTHRNARVRILRLLVGLLIVLAAVLIAAALRAAPVDADQGRPPGRSEEDRLTAWAASVMRRLEPAAPWTSTYESSARVLVQTAIERPLYPGVADGVKRTISVLLGLAYYESNFLADAEGDCITASGKLVPSVSGRCKDSTPHSYCMFQLNKSNFRTLGTSREEVQTDLAVCAKNALRMIHASFAICHARPLDDRLANYAAGGEGCGGPKGEGVDLSRHRMKKATWIHSLPVLVPTNIP